jgi:hypothetical protein
MASEHPEAAYAARLLERQDALQAEADRLLEQLDLPVMLGRAGRFVRLGSSVSGLMVWRDLDLGAHRRRLSPEEAWETMLPLAAHDPAGLPQRDRAAHSPRATGVRALLLRDAPRDRRGR